MPRTRDLGRSRELIAKRKQARAAAQWDPEQNDRSWQKFRRCEICNFRMVVNNYPDRKVRVPRRNGVVICNWCDRKDRDTGDFLTKMYILVTRLAEKEHKQDQVLAAAQKVIALSPKAKAMKRREQKALSQVLEPTEGSSNDD